MVATAEQTGSLSITVVVTPAESDPAPGDNSATETTTVNALRATVAVAVQAAVTTAVHPIHGC